ncbi:hypothetical protein C0995_014010, partial [Termitomyces sp. Mi166
MLSGVFLALTALGLCLPAQICLALPSASVRYPSTDLNQTQVVAPRAPSLCFLKIFCLPSPSTSGGNPATDPNQAQDTAASGLSEDPKCMEGKPGFQSNVWQIAVPASTWINRTASFFHSECGKDNTIGATRATLFEGTSLFNNTLVGYHRSPTQSVQRFMLTNGPVSLSNMTFYSYTEELKATSICGGTATYWTMTVTYCTDNPVGVHSFYDEYKRGKVQSLADELGASMFNGTCLI